MTIARDIANRAGGLKSSTVLQVNSSQTLPVTAFGATIQSFGTGPYTLTLPSTTNLPAGTAIEFGNFNGTGNTTILSGSANISPNGVAASVSSVVLGQGDTVTLVWSGSGWLSIRGSNQLAFSANFGSSLAASGYQRLPSGVIMQWGSGVSSGGGTLTITYPIAFPTASFSQSAFQLSGNGYLYRTAGTLSQMTLQSSTSAANTFAWMAVGN